MSMNNNDFDTKAFDETWKANHDRRFTTEALNETIEHGGLGLLHPRQAKPLLKLDTPERRQRAYNEATTLQNLSGGVLSSRIWNAVAALQALIEQGCEDQELYGEGAARRHRAAEAEARARTGQQVILYPPEMRR